MGLLWCRTYCVLWKVLKASPFKKSLGCRRPATGRICHPVVSLQNERGQVVRATMELVLFMQEYCRSTVLHPCSGSTTDACCLYLLTQEKA